MYSRPHYHLGLLDLDDGDWAAARARFERALHLAEIGPQAADAELALWATLRAQGSAEADSYLRAARVSIEAIGPHTMYSTATHIAEVRALSLLAEGEIEEAASEFKRAVMKEPQVAYYRRPIYTTLSTPPLDGLHRLVCEWSLAAKAKANVSAPWGLASCAD